MAGQTSRRIARYSGYGLLVLVVLLAGAITFTVGWRPIIGPKTRSVDKNKKFEVTQARLERGSYLANSIGNCVICHSPLQLKGKDEAEYSGAKFSGNTELFKMGDEFFVPTKNISSDPETGIGAWTDDEVARAIREGVSRDGHTLFPIMPYKNFSTMSDEDVASIVVYLRSLPPVKNAIPARKIPFMLERLINGAPQPVTSAVAEPNRADKASYGKYLATSVGDCDGCHTPTDEKGIPRPGLNFGGGNIFAESGRPVASMNLTPDPTGISYYDEAQFLETIRTGSVKGRKLNVMMPWWNYRQMTDDDLKSIFAFLRTLPPAKHRIDNTEPPTKCPLDGNEHGLGNKN